MTIDQKLHILTDSAKYDVSCSSSGSVRTLDFGGVGSVGNGGICHAYSADGRCISLLKILFTNYCLYDCAYCVNRISNDIRRAAFTPEEVAQLTINFYRRNMIEGLFLSSGIISSEDHTMRLILKTLQLLRHTYGFNGYIHVKLIPGASEDLIIETSTLADRVSSNIELPSSHSLALLAPDKTREKVLQPLNLAKNYSLEHQKKPIGMSTQLIIGATPESDLDILRLSTSLYEKAMLKRVYYSAYIPINNVKNLPSLATPPPLLREHRLYQADWLIRFYGFDYNEIVHENAPNLDERFDPKLAWALRNLDLFPIEINTADRETLLRIPGMGVRGVNKILKARRFRALNIYDLETMKISLKRLRYFVTVGGKLLIDRSMDYQQIQSELLSLPKPSPSAQPTLFDHFYPTVMGEL